MNEKVENLMLEHLRAIRGDVSRLTDDMRTVRAEITALRHQVSSVFTLQEHDHGDIASLKARVERIERRLDLID